MSEKVPNIAAIGLDLNSIISQKKRGTLSFALNAVVEGFDGNSVTYQNEQGNEECLQFPEGYVVIGKKPSIEFDITIFWLANPSTGDSEIGKVVGKSCKYETIINAKCLNHNINYPIHKAEIRKVNDHIQIFWANGPINPRRFLDLGKLPYKEVKNTNTCQTVITSEIDCNKLNVQPNFSIPEIDVLSVDSDGELISGTYQFAVQYANAAGVGFTSFYAHTNPVSVTDPLKVTPDFNFQTNKSITFEISNIDTTGIYDYINIAVIETINNISTYSLINTYKISNSTLKVNYTGANKTQIKLSANDIFEKFPYYKSADDITAVQDILVWKGLTLEDEINFQKVANKIHLQWQTWRMSATDKNDYSKGINTSDRRGYMGDEVYAFEFVPYLKSGQQLRSFPIPGRDFTSLDVQHINNRDVTNEDDSPCSVPEEGLPRWKVYNTASITGNDTSCVTQFTQGCDCYSGPWQHGEFAFWESSETYPCNTDIWGDLAGKPIRHHKFPDSVVAHIHDNQGNIFVKGIRIDVDDIITLLKNSDLSESIKSNIAGFKIVRGNRASNKSVIAKGLINNVGVYSKNSQSFFYPNYPYNDLREDPFISNSSNNDTGEIILSQTSEQISRRLQETTLYNETLPAGTLANVGDKLTIEYSGRFGSGSESPAKFIKVYFGGVAIAGIGTKGSAQDAWDLSVSVVRTSNNTISVSSQFSLSGNMNNVFDSSGTFSSFDFTLPIQIKLTGTSHNEPAVGLSPAHFSADADVIVSLENISYKAFAETLTPNLSGFATPESKARFTLHSPDTSFYQPFLGSQLKLETVEYGKSRGHFAEVQNHSKYKVLTVGAYSTALVAAIVVGFFSGTYGLSTNVFSGSAAFTAYQAVLDIIEKLVPRKNYAFQFNSIGSYNNYIPVPNDLGEKVRFADIATYLIPGMTTAGDIHTINNFQRESSVYVRTTDTLQFPQFFGAPEDKSRYTSSQEGICNSSDKIITKDISSFYASLKRTIPNQYGPIDSYEIIDTGFFQDIDLSSAIPYGVRYIFGGDTYINKFAYKSKVPFFIDNRVNFPDEADVFYNEIGNIGNPVYWFSTDSESGSSGGLFSAIKKFLGVRVNNLDCKGSKFFYQTGKFYLFSYGVPYFFCESEVNVDYRQAYNDKEGDFYPHIGTGIPDEWLQEKNVSIKFDNTYTYNKTFSKQNKENVFTHLPEDYLENLSSDLSNTAVFSERQSTSTNSRTNNWLIYRPVSKFDFPLNYGKLISLDGMENRQVLARFEKKSLLYNALLTAPTSAADVYLGQTIFSRDVPPLDFAETDLGYNGTQHKFLLKTEFGIVSVDSTRGQIFLIQGSRSIDISGEEYKAEQFFTSHLDFIIKDYFPDVNIDNHFNGVGIHGVYDNKYDRLILTKLDYQPIVQGITHKDGKFYYNENQISLSNTQYFCNKSFTISFNFGNKAWISFHSYVPNFYVGGANFFYSGLNSPHSSMWRHNTAISLYNNFYGSIHPYVIEYPYAVQYEDEIVQSISDYTKVNKYIDPVKYIQTDDIYFSKSIIYNDQQCTGILQLNPKKRNSLAQASQFPKYRATDKGILFTKSANFYNYNTIYDIVKDSSEPIFQQSCSPSIDKELNISNLDYSNRSFKKFPIRGKDCRIRHILDDRSDCRFISQFIITETQKSYK